MEEVADGPAGSRLVATRRDGAEGGRAGPQLPVPGPPYAVVAACPGRRGPLSRSPLL